MTDRRTKLELLKIINEFIEEGIQSGRKTFYKSDFRHPPAKINPDSAYEVLKLVEYCQTQMPRIRIVEMAEGRNVFIEVLGD